MKKRLLVFTHSGLCNRLLPLVSGLRAAKILKRQLVFCWADAPRRTGMKYLGSGRVKFNDLFENKIEEMTLEEVNQLDEIKWYTDWRGMKPYRWTPDGMNLKNPEVIISNVIPDNLADDIIAVRTSRLFGVDGDKPGLDFLDNIKTSYLTPPSFIDKIRPYFALLRPTGKLLNTINSYNVSIPEHTIGFHIRKTDFPQHKSSKDENMRIARIIDRAIIKYQAIKLYLSTDCRETEICFKKYYGERLITYVNDTKFINSIDGTEHAVIDLYLLAKCKWIFGTVHSTFSVVSWLLSKDATLQGEWWTKGGRWKRFIRMFRGK